MISLDLLRRFPFFSFMDDKELKAVATIAEELHPMANDVLIEADKPANALFFLIEGHLPYYMTVTTEHMPDYRREYFIGYINPNEIFGISAMIEPYQYTATLRAETPSRVIKIEAPALRALCEVDAHLSIGLMKAITKTAMERLQMTRVQLVTEMMKASDKTAV